MADLTFNTAANAVVARKLLLLFLNTGTEAAPVWSRIGKRVEDSSMEFDWGKETKKDIFGDIWPTMEEPVITQSFDPCELDSSDDAQVKIWNMAIREHDISAMNNNDMLVVHAYAGTKDTAVFAERYGSCAVTPTGLGGSSTVGMPIEVTFGGTRTTGTAAVSGKTVTFKADNA